jgi:hypothetical protein
LYVLNVDNLSNNDFLSDQFLQRQLVVLRKIKGYYRNYDAVFISWCFLSDVKLKIVDYKKDIVQLFLNNTNNNHVSFCKKFYLNHDINFTQRAASEIQKTSLAY